MVMGGWDGEQLGVGKYSGCDYSGDGESEHACTYERTNGLCLQC